MKITICGSIMFIDEMQEVKRKLEKLGHEVKLPPSEIVVEGGKTIPVKELYAIRHATDTAEGWIWDIKQEAMKNHFNKVVWSDAILVLNHSKNNIAGYIGANTLLEMGLALHLGKKIYLLYPIPEISYKEEILGMKPAILNDNLNLI